ncbi:antitoxin VapB family protein [Methanoplanus endosymbiosus]|uniref:Antitoxin n=1 Tax=Methanoplanus endosymbiosus TaxID=33865 RepID=A0A9E7PTK8_9EURY|nr:antitoxin VapB family protein [Methanoplanus endosymbiosus]UUX93712.1 antitoxin [Methanoplanus endosymbiosus]
MTTRTIPISDEAYNLLKGLKKTDMESFSDVIIRNYSGKRKLSDVLNEIGNCNDLADSIEKVSKEMRREKMREVKF